MKKLFFLIASLLLSSPALANNSNPWPIYPNYFNSPVQARALLGAPGISTNETISGNWTFASPNTVFGSLTNPAQTSITINNSVNTAPNTSTGSYGLQVGTFVTASVPRGSSADFYTGGAFGTVASVNEGGTQTTLSQNVNINVAAGSFVVGQWYGIVTVGSTDFTAIGASANTVGVLFQATGVGSGSGTASDAQITVTDPTNILGRDGLRIMLNDGKFWFYHLNTLGTAGQQLTNPILLDHGSVFAINSGTAVYDNKGVATTWNTDVELTSGANNWYGAISGAVGVINQTPNTYIVCGVCVEAEHNHLYPGVAIDTAFGVSDQSGAEPGFKSILSINSEEGRMPVDSTSTIFISQGFASVKSFIDFSSMSCSTFEINFFGFNVDCAGSSTSLRVIHTGQEQDQSITSSIPTTGGTVNIASGVGSYVIKPATSLSTLTLNLPQCNNGALGYVVSFMTTQAVTTLTMGTISSIGTISNPLTSLSANEGHIYKCFGAVWYKFS